MPGYPGWITVVVSLFDSVLGLVDTLLDSEVDGLILDFSGTVVGSLFDSAVGLVDSLFDSSEGRLLGHVLPCSSKIWRD